MKLWVFAADNLKNIRIGYEQNLWAVSILDSRTMKNRRSKSEKMSPFSRGIIYSSADKTFTMPFRTLSYPEWKKVEGVWPEPWALPFQIRPLGPPTRLVSLDVAKRTWPILGKRRNATHALNGLNGRTTFVPNEIEKEDWDLILKDLATESDSDCPEPQEPVPFILRDLL